MRLSDDIERLISQKKQGISGNNQLQLADEIEKTLEKMGIPLQPGFEIPLSTRVSTPSLK